MYVTPRTTGATATATIQSGAVTKITVTGIGANYTTTPTVVLTGGKTDGTVPTDRAKAYANLNNDLVRDFDTTIKFDRVSSTSSVVDWTASTSYAYGQLIRYKNELYKATDPFTYVRLGTFLQFLQDVIVFQQKGVSANLPAKPGLRFDYDVETNIMDAYDRQVSFDPKICVVNRTIDLNFNPASKKFDDIYILIYQSFLLGILV